MGRVTRRGAPVVALLCAFLALPLATASASVPSAAARGAAGRWRGEADAGLGDRHQSGALEPEVSDRPHLRALRTARRGDRRWWRGLHAAVQGGREQRRRDVAGRDEGLDLGRLRAGQRPGDAGAAGDEHQDRRGGTDQDAAHDLLLAMRPYYETWGRDIDVKFYTSTGTDEAAQRADAVAIKAMKPFAVVNSYNAGYGTMAIELAKAKILVYDAETGREDFTALAPYLWGSTDSQVAAINAAEVLGKQLVGKKAEYASGDVKGQTRKFGVITKDGDVDVPGFKKELAKYKGTVTSEATYPPTGGTYGDATLAGQLRRRSSPR